MKKMIMAVAFVSSIILLNPCFSAENEKEGYLSGLTESFESTYIITLKYIPPRTLVRLQRLPDKSSLGEGWSYSASLNCIISCSDWPEAKRVRDFLESGEVSSEPCPVPDFAVLEFRSTMTNYAKDIYISVFGTCFTFDGQAYNTQENFLNFVRDDVISIFSIGAWN
jgi:hypothetical protein